MNKKEMILEYIKYNVAPILVDFLSGSDFNNAIVLPAKVEKEELNGHYEDIEFVPPKWFKELLNGKKLLIIDKIDTISKDEQLKFIELLKYKKISTFDLPDDIRIIITANKISKDTINEEIISLVAKI